MSVMINKRHYQIASAAFLLSIWLHLDVALDLICARIPLLIYLLAAAIGFSLGGPASRIFGRSGRGWWLLRWGGKVVIALGAVAFLKLLLNPVQLGTKCSWRSCGRALGPGLMVSPFPSAEMSCQELWRCASEYKYTVSERTVLDKMLEQQGCEPL